jgi:hypothetical protein
MRCHFHLIAPSGPITDRKGIEVADFDQALEEALSALRELREEDPAAARDWAGCKLQITDESGALLTSIALDDPALRHHGHFAPQSEHNGSDH